MRGKKQKEPVGMNSAEIFAALAMLEKERGIPQSFMMDKIIQAITTAYKRDHEGVENVIVDVDDEHQTLKMYVQKNVVEEEDYVDPFNEMPIEEAKLLSSYNGRAITLGVRPENIVIGNDVQMKVNNCENLGHNTLVHGTLNGHKITAKIREWCSFKHGEEIGVSFNRKHFFDKETTNAIR